MTTWTTFETIDEMATRRENSSDEFTRNIDNTFWVDRLGIHQHREDDRTRFEFSRAMRPDCSLAWVVYDREAEGEDQADFTTGTMRECVAWLSARMIYGA